MTIRSIDLDQSYNLQYQAQDSAIFKPLTAKVLERFLPYTCSVVLLVTSPSRGRFILKLNDRRFGFRNSPRMKFGELPWSPSIENRLRHAVERIHTGDIPDWLELLEDDLHKREQLPDVYSWEDWMWKYLHGHTIPRFYGTVRLPISTSPLHPITAFVPGFAVEYIEGTNMDSLKPGIDLPLDEAEKISDQVMDAFRSVKNEMCVLHNDVHIGNVILRATDRSPVIIDFGYVMIRKPNMSDAEWMELARQCSDISSMRAVLADGKWRRKQTPRPMSDYLGKYRTPFHFNKYVEEMPEDYRLATFERIPDTDESGAREKGFEWRTRPGVRCRE
ncbi:uncharacterized protein EV420DRAFT_1643129 [Desarmillaria tabescens]|uniref:Aminoglycoside phosphotransferase domain-containing protein n=1 Tax=Armillaria tabescens TaxID=1929756 RepID=A0AA39KG98_ARMTA|nr:uncharacterized protein EV420DRAFT_1643129 [Desarmillaria tabescens]KAK0458248.1 hypothetical protein EV420DRAFT_1643129 [Desarmillaria tabescens]